MKNKPIFIILFSSLLVIFAASLLSEPLRFGICRHTYTWIPQNDGISVIGCSDNTSIFQAPGVFAVALFFISFILLFLRKEIYQTWKNFAVWWIPISALFIIGASPSSSSSLDSFGMGMDRESVTMFFAVLFLVISLVLITYKSIKLRNK